MLTSLRRDVTPTAVPLRAPAGPGTMEARRALMATRRGNGERTVPDEGAVSSEVRVRIQILGPVTVTDHAGGTARLGRRREALIAALALARPRALSVDRLGEVVWPSEPPATWRNTLQVHVSWLRRNAGLDIRSSDAGYRLVCGADDVDVDAFRSRLREADELFDACGFDETALAAAHPQVLASAKAAYGEALAWWRGEPLPEFEYEEWAQADRAALVEMYLSALTRWYRCELSLGREREATGPLRQLVSQMPLREDVWWLLIQALHRQRREGEALEASAQARRVLREELGIDPGPKLRELQQVLLRADEAPSLHRDLAAMVPLHRTSFVGRDGELLTLAGLLRAAPPWVVSLVGPGGVGKTRLAAECTVRVEHPPVTWISLEGLTVSTDVPAAAAKAVGIGTIHGDVLGQLALSARVGPGIWVLDNCEHVLDGARAVAQAALTPGSRVGVLTTSREALKLLAEQVVNIRPLPFATSDDDVTRLPAAAQLLRDRVAARAQRAPTRAELLLVAESVDGLPLALELAAATLGEMTADDLVRDADGVLMRPETPWADSAPRHRGLLQSLEWSWSLLEHDEQAFLAALGTFAGTFDIGAAAAVTGNDYATTRGLLSGLASRSMVVADVDHDIADEVALSGGAGPDADVLERPVRAARSRFRLMRTVRSFAQGRLTQTEAGACLQRLVAHYRDQVSEGSVAGGLVVDLGAERIRELLADRDNLREAFTHALTDHVWDAAQLACRLTMPWVLTGLWGEIEDMLTQCVQLLGSEQGTSAKADETLAELLFCQAFVAGNRADMVGCRDSARRAAALAAAVGRPDLELLSLTTARIGEPDPERVPESTRISELLAEEMSYSVRSVALLAMALTAWYSGDSRGTVNRLLASLDEARRAGSNDLQAIALSDLAEVAVTGGRDREAKAWAERAVRNCSVVPRSTALVWSRSNLAAARLGLGELDAAETMLDAVCRQSHAGGDHRITVEALLRLACVAAARGNAERAFVLLSGYQAQLRAHRWEASPSEVAMSQRYGLATRVVPDVGIGAGAGMTLEDLVAYGAQSSPTSLEELEMPTLRRPPAEPHAREEG